MNTDLTEIYEVINNAIDQPKCTKDDIENIKAQINEYLNDKIEALQKPILCDCCGNDFIIRMMDHIGQKQS